MDQQNIKTIYDSIKDQLDSLLEKVYDAVNHVIIVKKIPHVDHIAKRVKTYESFLNKSQERSEDKLKYPNPFKEIQDLLGIRVILYYLSDVEKAVEIFQEAFNRIEINEFIPDSPKDFDYQGKHIIALIPPSIYNDFKNNKSIPKFFELQILTLYQHAWAAGEHDLGYKPIEKHDLNIKRHLAFLAAQSWGADQIFEKIIKKKL